MIFENPRKRVEVNRVELQRELCPFWNRVASYNEIVNEHNVGDVAPRKTTKKKKNQERTFDRVSSLAKNGMRDAGAVDVLFFFFCQN